VGTFKHYYVKTPQHTYSLDILGDGSAFKGRYKRLGSRDVVDVNVGEDFEPGATEAATERTMHYLLCRCISEIEKSDGPVTALIDIPQGKQDKRLH
jgi:hypothetical protein